MPVKAIETLDVRSRGEWRTWLGRNHGSKSEIWLVFHKQHTGITCLSYTDAVEEALCFGWIDSIVRRLDEERYARKFTPRNADSKWSAINRKRYADLRSRGLLAAPGRKRAPTARTYGAVPAIPSTVPAYITKALKANAKAWETFQRLAPSYRRAYVAWIDSAKREETRERRLREALSLLAAGRKLGLK